MQYVLGAFFAYAVNPTMFSAGMIAGTCLTVMLTAVFAKIEAQK